MAQGPVNPSRRPKAGRAGVRVPLPSGASARQGGLFPPMGRALFSGPHTAAVTPGSPPPGREGAGLSSLWLPPGCLLVSTLNPSSGHAGGTPGSGTGPPRAHKTSASLSILSITDVCVSGNIPHVSGLVLSWEPNTQHPLGHKLAEELLRHCPDSVICSMSSDNNFLLHESQLPKQECEGVESPRFIPAANVP